MPATRVVKEEPIEWWRCPIFEYGHELTLTKEWLDIVAMDLQQTQSILRSSDRQRSIIHDEVSFNRRLERRRSHLAPSGAIPRVDFSPALLIDDEIAAQLVEFDQLCIRLDWLGRLAREQGLYD